MLFKRDIHGIPHQRFDLTEKDYRTIWTDLCLFLNYDENSSAKPQPSLFALNCSKQNNCLNWIAKKAGRTRRTGRRERKREKRRRMKKKKRGNLVLIRSLGKENIFGEIQPIEELIYRTHSIYGQPIKSSQVFSFFETFINNSVKLYKCKFHIKAETERSDLKSKGYVLSPFI